MADDQGLGRKIAVQRAKRGLSQRQFAALIGRSEAWVSQVERGVRPVKNTDVLERIAQELGVSLADLAPTTRPRTGAQSPAGQDHGQ